MDFNNETDLSRLLTMCNPSAADVEFEKLMMSQP